MPMPARNVGDDRPFARRGPVSAAQQFTDSPIGLRRRNVRTVIYSKGEPWEHERRRGMKLLSDRRKWAAGVPLTVAVVLLTAACGTTRTVTVAQPLPPPAPAPANTTADSTAKLVEAVAAYLDSQAAAPKKDPSLDEINQRALHEALAKARAQLAAATKQQKQQAQQAQQAQQKQAQEPA